MNHDLAGTEMHNLAKELWPICRSLTGEGVEETLGIIKNLLPGLQIKTVPSGEKVFDWEVPSEWNIKDAYILCPDGNKIIDFKENNLHVVSYSEPIDKILSLEELQKNLHSRPHQPDAIPYITSYYQRRWGFCLTQKQRDSLKPGNYQVKIESSLNENGKLTYGELLVPGKSKNEIFLSTYVCHPSMANNELSGPVVTTQLAKWILKNTDRNYSYRIIFIPETIGAITYISKNLEEMKERIIAGFQVTCIGDERCYSYLPSRKGDSIADQAALKVLSETDPSFIRYTYLDRASDERQYCSPGVDLPVASIMRSKYHEYPEYHSSLDDLNLVTPKGLQGGYDVLRKSIDHIEKNLYPKATVLCEPQMGKRGLYPTLGAKTADLNVKTMMNILAFSDGTNDLETLSKKLNIKLEDLKKPLDILVENGLITIN